MTSHLTRFFLLLLVTSSFVACRDSSKLPAPATEDVPLIIPVVNPQKGYFDNETSRKSINNLAAAGQSRPVFEFVVDPSQGYGEIQTVEVYKSYRRDNKLGPRVKVMDLTSFPATVSINSQDALTGLYTNSPTTAVPAPLPLLAPNATRINGNLLGDAVVFTFEYIMKDGRRIILTPLSTLTGSVGAPTGTFINQPFTAVAQFL